MIRVVEETEGQMGRKDPQGLGDEADGGGSDNIQIPVKLFSRDSCRVHLQGIESRKNTNSLAPGHSKTHFRFVFFHLNWLQHLLIRRGWIKMLVYNFYQKHIRGLPSWSSEHRFNPWSVRIPYAAGQLSQLVTRYSLQLEKTHSQQWRPQRANTHTDTQTHEISQH